MLAHFGGATVYYKYIRYINLYQNTTFHFISTRLLSSEGGGSGGSGTNKRKVEVLSEPMAFEDVDDITSLRQEDSKRDRIIA